VKTLEKDHMLRCAASLVTATYIKVGLIPQDSRALSLAFFQSFKCKRNNTLKKTGVDYETFQKQ
jgi:hypothetical protein